MTPEEFEAEFNEALRLWHSGASEDAVQLLGRLLGERQRTASVVGMIGIIRYFGLHQPHQALPFLRQAVELAPGSEQLSLALFHALLELDHVDEAFDEMRRYLADHASDAYAEFLKDVNAE